MAEAATYDVRAFERPSVTVDLVIFTLINQELHVLLLQRKQWPCAGAWAIPGGFIHMDESLEAAARRKLAEETGITEVYLEQLYTFGDPGRDPRTRVITVAYMALVRASQQQLIVSAEAIDINWFSVADLPAPIAFDHAQIVDHAVQRLRSKFEYTTLAFQLLPHEFTLAELYDTYGQLLGGGRREDAAATAGEWAGVDKRNFYRKILDTNVLQDTGHYREGRGRPAKLYTFARDRQHGPFVFRWREGRPHQ